jgi:hypothetical protein
MDFETFRKIERYTRYSARAFFRDTCNRIAYGPDAPLYAERIWVNPQGCQDCLVGLGDRYSAKVILSGWPPTGATSRKIDDLVKIRSCKEHWGKGTPWEETGVFGFLEKEIKRHPRSCFDDCRNPEDIKRRYDKLDVVFEEVRKDGALKKQVEIDRWAFREKDGVFVHLGPGGSLFLGGGGCHRFAMALVLGLTRIPAKVGCVHVTAFPRLRELRAEESC